MVLVSCQLEYGESLPWKWNNCISQMKYGFPLKNMLSRRSQWVLQCIKGLAVDAGSWSCLVQRANMLQVLTNLALGLFFISWPQSPPRELIKKQAGRSYFISNYLILYPFQLELQFHDDWWELKSFSFISVWCWHWKWLWKIDPAWKKFFKKYQGQSHFDYFFCSTIKFFTGFW